jgi:RES domain-containing protein
MVTAWRLVNRRNADQAFSGAGAKRHGGRRNPKGTAVVSPSATLSLAALEIMVHAVSYQVLRGYVAFPVEFPVTLLAEVNDFESLPLNWREDPPPPKLGEIGKAWVRNQSSLALKVPSAIIPREFNYLLNPQHPDFGALGIHPQEPFEFDERLIKDL